MEIQIIHRSKSKWAVRKPGLKRATKIFKSFKEAETFVRNMPDISKIYIHRRDGTVARTITFLVEVGRGKTTTIDFHPEEP
jgi:hypothetical protein